MEVSRVLDAASSCRVFDVAAEVVHGEVLAKAVIGGVGPQRSEYLEQL